MRKVAEGYCVICCDDACSMKYGISEMACSREAKQTGCGSFWASARELNGLPMGGLWSSDSW